MSSEEELMRNIHSYLDQTFLQNQQLLLLAELCMGCAHADMLDGYTVESLGSAIKAHVDRQRALQHLFLGSQSPDLYEPALAAERARLESEGHKFLSTNNTNAESEE